MLMQQAVRRPLLVVLVVLDAAMHRAQVPSTLYRRPKRARVTLGGPGLLLGAVAVGGRGRLSPVA